MQKLSVLYEVQFVPVCDSRPALSGDTEKGAAMNAVPNHG